mmetsp:Transcript_19965/g.43459  ORF Transcript_19965/g.43459 Transcript_19965/m.43459 type:complete len:237 (+) Transcript_19965:2380-3090(+)
MSRAQTLCTPAPGYVARGCGGSLGEARCGYVWRGLQRQRRLGRLGNEMLTHPSACEMREPCQLRGACPCQSPACPSPCLHCVGRHAPCPFHAPSLVPFPVLSPALFPVLALAPDRARDPGHGPYPAPDHGRDPFRGHARVHGDRHYHHLLHTDQPLTCHHMCLCHADHSRHHKEPLGLCCMPQALHQSLQLSQHQHRECMLGRQAQQRRNCPVLAAQEEAPHCRRWGQEEGASRCR